MHYTWWKYLGIGFGLAGLLVLFLGYTEHNGFDGPVNNASFIILFTVVLFGLALISRIMYRRSYKRINRGNKIGP